MTADTTRVAALTAQGLSARQIADHLGVSTRTVVRYRTTPEDTMHAPDTLKRDHGWRAYALCAQTDPKLFHPEEGESADKARAICMGCDVRTQCLEYALGRETQGVWGGLSAGERRALLKKRTQAEPVTVDA